MDWEVHNTDLVWMELMLGAPFVSTEQYNNMQSK